MARDTTDIVEGKLNRQPRTKASLSATPRAFPTLASQKIQTADYIAHMADEMAVMSRAIGLPLLAHLLYLVKAQADLEAKIAREE